MLRLQVGVAAWGLAAAAAGDVVHHFQLVAMVGWIMESGMGLGWRHVAAVYRLRVVVEGTARHTATCHHLLPTPVICRRRRRRRLVTCGPSRVVTGSVNTSVAVVVEIAAAAHLHLLADDARCRPPRSLVAG